MAVVSAMTNRYKAGLFTAEHNHSASGGDTFRVGLFDDTAGVAGTYDATTNIYSQVTGDEHPATGGYVLKGEALTNVDPAEDDTNNVAFVDFSNDITYALSTIASSAAFIVNDTHTDEVIVSLHDFGGDRISTGGDFVIQMPAPAFNTAILRLA